MIARISFLILLISWSSNTWGDIVCYDNQVGNTISYIDIGEVSRESVPLYGEPWINGDILNFPGIGFISQATDQQIELLSGRLMLTIEAAEGFLIDSITVSQRGSFLTFGNTAEAMATAEGFATIGNQTYNAGLLFDNLGPGQGDWFGEFTIAFPATESISFVLDSSLLTFAGLNEAAFIDNVGIQISVGSFAAVPEPSGAVVCLMSLVVGLGLVGQRRR